MLLIGSSASRRAALLRAALQSAGGRLAVVEWRDLLNPGIAFEAQLCAVPLADHIWCKIDPPGEDTAATNALIERGWSVSGRDGLAPRPLRHGELAFQHWYFAGFAEVLTRIERELKTVRLMNSVDDILAMCDKWACQRRLLQHGVPVPELLGELRTLDELDEQFPARRFPAVFIKSRFGSSAAGVIALRRHPDGRVIAHTSARMERDGAIYNHLSISRYTDRESIALLVQRLASQGAYAERWAPKPRVPTDRSACYDLRVVASCGKARQRIARLSRSPMTNLHLGNQRAAPAWLSDAQTLVLEHTASRAADAFPNSRCIGFDVSLHERMPCVLEANAFGDLLPNLQYHSATTYDDQARWVSADER